MLFKSKILKFSFYHDVLKSMIDELTSLMNSYVTVIQGETEHNLHVCIATVSADNLGAHSLAGFSCYFSSGRIC